MKKKKIVIMVLILLIVCCMGILFYLLNSISLKTVVLRSNCKKVANNLQKI